MAIRQITEAELEAIAQRAAHQAATEVLRKLGCPDPEADPAGAVRWAHDLQIGVEAVGAVKSERDAAGADLARCVSEAQAEASCLRRQHRHP